MTAMPASVDALPQKGSRTSDYDYELPEERIAQREERSTCDRPAHPPRSTSTSVACDSRTCDQLEGGLLAQQSEQWLDDYSVVDDIVDDDVDN